ncbi:MAG: hypothetical protein IJU76_02995 [Desulfovibrionaceae bacterium]|nr:hypothetical protein [Desulfovibrionaceae bacterium]
MTKIVYIKRCIPIGDFQKIKTVRSGQPVAAEKVYGFRKFDKVSSFGKEYFITRRMSSSYAILYQLTGQRYYAGLKSLQAVASSTELASTVLLSSIKSSLRRDSTVPL